MIYYGLPNANASMVSVTTSATLLQNLINTAGSSSAAFPFDINGVDLYLEDGDIRVLFDGNNPTSSKGIFLKKGTYIRLRNVQFHLMSLISATGNNVTVDVQCGFAAPEESTSSGNVPFFVDQIAGEDLTVPNGGVLKVEQRYSYFTSTSAATSVVKNSAGYLDRINILGGTAGAITAYDNTTNSGTVILPTFTPGNVTVPVSLPVHCVFATGLTIVTGAATILQLAYR